MTRCPPRVQCRGVVPAVSHIMLHSDTLANEFNEILNGVEIFAPFQPLDPAVTFYAPLRTSVRDLRLNQDDFQRASNAWYKDGSGIYRHVGINRARFEESRLLMEQAQTNKNTNYNANPDSALINVLQGNGQKNRIFDPASIAAAGLQDICPSGFLIELFNDTAGEYNAGPAGNVGNLNTHAASCWVNTFGDTVSFGIGGNRHNINTTSLQHVEYIGVGTSDLSTLVFRLGPGERVHFILNQLEESPVVTSPIVSEGTAGQRAIDILNYDDPDSWFNQATGMAIVTFQPLYPCDGTQIVQLGNYTSLLTLDTGNRNLLFVRNSSAAGAQGFGSFAGAAEPRVRGAVWNAGSVINVAVRWSSAPSLLNVGMQIDGGAWVWGDQTTYTGAFNSTNVFRIGNTANDLPRRYGDVIIFNEDKGRDWIEDNYP